MPFAVNQGIRIHYEVEGTGESLVLHHGLLFSSEGWRADGYAEHLKEHHQLIMVDARGHGTSDKPLDPACYTTQTMAGDILAVLDELGLRQTHYWGHSLGAVIGFSLLKYAPDRMGSLIAGGYSPYVPYSEDEAKYLSEMRADLEVATQGGMAAWLSTIEQRSGIPFPPPLARRLAQNEPQALLACLDGVLAWPGVGDVLKERVSPCLLYAGTEDAFHSGVRRAAQDLPNAAFISLPGLAHVGSWFAADQVLPHVERFLATLQMRRGR